MNEDEEAGETREENDYVCTYLTELVLVVCVEHSWKTLFFSFSIVDPNLLLLGWWWRLEKEFHLECHTEFFFSLRKTCFFKRDTHRTKPVFVRFAGMFFFSENLHFLLPLLLRHPLVSFLLSAGRKGRNVVKTSESKSCIIMAANENNSNNNKENFHLGEMQARCNRNVF